MKNLSDLKLTNENGESSFFHDIIKDKLVVLNMFYSNCEIKCLPLGLLLRKVNFLLKRHFQESKDIIFMSVSLDPENDTPDDLKRFSKQVTDGHTQNWHFYTGNPKEIHHLRYQLGMYNPEPEIDQVKSNHTGSFMIFNTETGFVKHTQAFDNPVDIARKVIQMTTNNFRRHSYNLDKLCYDSLTEEELFENIQTMHSVYTVSMLPEYLQKAYEYFAEKQRGFQYKPPIDNRSEKTGCCCRNSKPKNLPINYK